MEWINAKEKIPEDEQEVLVTNGCEVMSATFFNDGGRKFICAIGVIGSDFRESFDWESVTHWMPLPKPPTADNSV